VHDIDCVVVAKNDAEWQKISERLKNLKAKPKCSGNSLRDLFSAQSARTLVTLQGDRPLEEEWQELIEGSKTVDAKLKAWKRTSERRIITGDPEAGKEYISKNSE
jgi:hypothetical protein